MPKTGAASTAGAGSAGGGASGAGGWTSATEASKAREVLMPRFAAMVVDAMDAAAKMLRIRAGIIGSGLHKDRGDLATRPREGAAVDELERMNRIEESVAFAERTVEELSEQVAALGRAIERMLKRVEAIESRLGRVESAGEEDGVGDGVAG